MDELDILLNLVENPTRRRILQHLVQEPCYALQLSKELGVSTQAVLKNLALMEQYGMILRSEAKSDMGPNRTLYTPNREFTLVVDLRNNVFSAKLIGPEETESTIDHWEDAERRIEEIDRRIEELDQERSRLLTERSLIASAMRRNDDQKSPE